MRARFVILLCIVLTLAGLAVVERSQAPDPLAQGTLEAMLARPLEASSSRGPAPAEGTPQPLFWRALLARSGTVADERTTLRLGLVLADPSAAHLAAERAGELLDLAPEDAAGDAAGGPGQPLWRAVLEGPASERTEQGRTLKLFGCRHSADAAAGPTIEDSYHARLALAAALRARITAAEPGVALTVLGEEVPVRGGANFEVALRGPTQSVVVTFDGQKRTPLRVSREFRPEAPNDARARANLVAALRRVAEREGLALELDGAEAPVAGGVDLRLEVFGSRLALSTTDSGARLATHLELAPDGSAK